MSDETDDVDTIEIVDDEERTPTAVGRCSEDCAVVPVSIVSPPPGSSHEAMRFSTCVVSAGGGWSWCASGCFLRLGDWPRLFLGAERRAKVIMRTDAERRRRFPTPSKG